MRASQSSWTEFKVGGVISCFVSGLAMELVQEWLSISWQSLGCWDRVEDTVSIPVELGKNYFALAFTFDSLSYHRKEASPLSFTFCLSKGIFLEILSKSLFLLL